MALASAYPHGLLFADGGFCGAEYNATMELLDVQFISPDKHKLRQRPPSETAKARIRLSSSRCSPTSSARCAWRPTSPRPSPGSRANQYNVLP